MAKVHGPVQHIIWEGDIAVIRPDVAMVMVGKGYARHPTETQVQEWNEKVQAWIDSQFVPDDNETDDTPDTPDVTEDNTLGPQNDTPDETGGDMTTEETPTEETPTVEETSTEETSSAEETASEETPSEETTEETSETTTESVTEEEAPTPKKKRR